MFRVILTEGSEELLIGDFDSFREACLAAARRAESPDVQLQIFDETGRKIGHLGTA